MADVKEVTIGVIVRPHGLHGMVKVVPETEDPERFRRLEAVELRLQGRSLGSFRLERIIVESRGLRIKFHQLDSLASVEPLRGAQIVIARESCLPTGEQEYYAFELLGLPVYTSAGRLVGTLSDVVPYPANDVWVVRDASGREWLLPAISSVIKSVEMTVPRIVIEPLEGLLDDSTSLP